MQFPGMDVFILHSIRFHVLSVVHQLLLSDL